MSDDESISEQQQRESNNRIYKALRRLRRTGVKHSLQPEVTNARTWGTLCVGYPDEHSDARMHCILKPFLYVATPREKIDRALSKHGILPMKIDGNVIENVYVVVGAVDSFKKIQLFMTDNVLQEYLLLS